MGDLAGSTTASAHRGPCSHCGPLPPTVHVHTIYKHLNKTYVTNKNVTVHVPRYHRIVNVTRIQPIVHVHKLTVVHHHTICYKKDIYSHVVEHLRPIVHVSTAFRATFDCHCR